ncbi:uncharacterized protein ACLA_065280 [Aspergillus clavatus NRRL 1]|uniref:Uncharacterized protein n=1 Tax=Aspergillus clavatus (strain ATCC 1007 / CBS 513.65 / DSM 816 / NCTC 3887 / NRRL 1 / QM 1276 / 107) TaxID=344612 RepID=A1CG14_ASPCL|nr:uncharacterized protein ACLA_065280 [Aspergillus clavatus NRRL 1]EAW10894.1 hypothetical protein ACLA_065280 [Aspergillus clavatus NRRL 1]
MNMQLEDGEIVSPRTDSRGHAVPEPPAATQGEQVQGDDSVHRLPATGSAIKVEDSGQTSGEWSLITCRRDPPRVDVTPRHRKTPTRRRSLASFGISELSESQVLFYLGVLGVEALLLPRFQYTRCSKKGMWLCKLTIYGHTFDLGQAFHTKFEARCEVSRKAMARLQRQFPDWTVPEEPRDGLCYGWDWVEILREYCIQNALPAPEYTKYNHKQGYRHVVEVADTSHFGALKHYTRERDSRNAAAHMALHTLLVSKNEPPSGLCGPVALCQSDQSQLALVPREQIHVDDSGAGIRHPFAQYRHLKRSADDGSQETTRGNRKKARTPSTRDVQGIWEGNANLLPLADNVRLQPVEEPDKKDEKRWSVTPAELELRFNGLGLYTWKLREICQLLSLENPEIRTTKKSVSGMETNGDYKVGAYFKDDPFLARASPVGQIEFKGTVFGAQQACARVVIEYLINMVKEDTLLEDQAAQERDRLKNWGNTTF